MFIRTLCIVLTLLASGGCRSAKDLLGSSGAGNAEIVPGGEVSEALDALVSRSDDGVRFRRDLPFPPRLEVRMIQSLDYQNVRVVEVSALGKNASTLNFETETEIWCSKNPGLFELRLEAAGRRVLAEDEESGELPKLESDRVSELEGESLSFALTESGWRARLGAGAVDFKKAVWADSLEGGVPQLMVETGGHPRVQWFSSSRVWKAGDEIVLTGSALKILDPFDVSGRVRLRFDGSEAVGGHPCGVFLITGDMRVDDQLQVDGSHQDTDISITSGKIWASLLHPVILREEYETVQTLTKREGKRGGPEKKMQGSFRVKKSRNWIPHED
ncbi:hypothetical protein [Haloferula sp.]|uniref:hypothetical protein n=1 Tax=Haloferula sp. TaxID=2497595 RepID=UPI003C783FF8